MYFILEQAIALLDSISNNLTEEQLMKLEDLKRAMKEYSSSDFDNYNYD